MSNLGTTRILIRNACALLLTFAIVANTRADGSEGSYGSQAIPLYQCDFEAGSDQNFDLWPDGWTRRRGPGYPQYIDIGIHTPPKDPTHGRCLKIEMDGGASYVSSALIPITSRFSYAVEMDIKIQGMKRDLVTMMLTFLDENQQPLETVETKPVVMVSGWQHLTIRPAVPHNMKTHSAVVSVHVRPGEREDLTGSVLVDNLVVLRLPQMVVHTDRPNALYQQGENVKIQVEISGILVTDSILNFELINTADQTIRKHSIELGKSKTADRQKKQELDESLASETWSPWNTESPPPGFYYVRVSLKDKGGNGLQRTIRLAVVVEQPVPKMGEFGWSLPDSERPVGVQQMVTILRHAGVNWIKYPVWYGEKDTTRVENIVRLSDQLDEMGIETIGMLDQPPPALAKQLGDQAHTPSAIVFAEKNLWEPALDIVLTRLSHKIRCWQLGGDDDGSFVGDPALPGKMQDVRKQLVRFGESMRLGIPWKFVQAPPEDYVKIGNFLSYSDRPATTAQEIMQATSDETTGQAERWLALHPLKRDEYTPATRTRDLVERMVAAKIKKYTLTFIPRPFDDEEGLFLSDGTPGELFLPWRTTALSLAGRDYLGSLRLPNGSENHLFTNGTDAVMVIWNPRPTTETVYLGENITAIDMWGSPLAINTEQTDDRLEQVIPAGPAPIFVFGINAKLAQWCMTFDFENSQLQSLLGQSQTVAFKYQNPFARSVGGSFTIHAPAVVADTKPVNFRASPNEIRTSSFPLLLKPEAGSGLRPVRIDFNLTADRDYHFSLYRNMVIGLKGIDVDLDTHLEEDGYLEVRANLSNQTEESISFQCHLFVPERRRDKIQLLYLGSERRTITFRIPNGRELIGKDLVLRLEEIGGSRVMNQHLRVQE